jgi:solute carrier family 25 phosphate transporter 23/24/25/41
MSVPKALAKMWREEGWRGFMAGNGTNCIRIVPYSAVQFSAYNVYKRVSSPVPVSRRAYGGLTSRSSSNANQEHRSMPTNGCSVVASPALPP